MRDAINEEVSGERVNQACALSMELWVTLLVERYDLETQYGTYPKSQADSFRPLCLRVLVPSKDTAVVVTALSRHIRKLPATLRRSLTWDRGLEMAKHKDFTVATDVQVYFCDPQSPWQRGTNENTNLLLRQYFPRGTDLSGYSQAQLDRVALRLNQRPRKTLGFQTPASKLQASVASTI
jgi:IS30 family transposase